MNEEIKDTSDIDPSGLFMTYKTNPGEHESDKSEGIISPISPISSSGGETGVKIEEKDTLRALKIVVDGFVRITKVAVWSIAVIGGLFIAALATNTIDRAIQIINANTGTHFIISQEASIKIVNEDPTNQNQSTVTSNALNSSSSNTPETIANKRRAILEAKKAAKMLEEKQNILNQIQ